MLGDMWMKPEEWRPVYNFSDYEVSNKGRVRNLLTKEELYTYYKGSILKVNLRNDNGKKQEINVKVIMAEAFHGGPQPGCKVTFIDGNRQNLHADNLRWQLTIYR